MDWILVGLLIATAVLFTALTLDEIRRRSPNGVTSEPTIKSEPEPEDGQERKAA